MSLKKRLKFGLHLDIELAEASEEKTQTDEFLTVEDRQESACTERLSTAS